MTPKKNQGFTLIELMIVIAIIGILAAIAVPQYKQFSNQALVSSEGLSAARPFQQAVNEYYLSKQALPDNASNLRLASVTGETSRVQLVSVAADSSGQITILFRGAGSDLPTEIQGRTLTLAPVINVASGLVNWSVSTADSTLDAAYLPKI